MWVTVTQRFISETLDVRIFILSRSTLLKIVLQTSGATVDSALFVPFFQLILILWSSRPTINMPSLYIPIISPFPTADKITSTVWFTPPLSFSHCPFSHCVFTLWTLFIISRQAIRILRSLIDSLPLISPLINLLPIISPLFFRVSISCLWLAFQYPCYKPITGHITSASLISLPNLSAF